MNSTQRFTRLWTEAQPSVRGFLAAAVPDFSAAEDLTQEVAVALLQQFEQGREPKSFRSWAIAVARNKVRMHYRTHARSPLVFDDDLLDAAAWEEMLLELDPRTFDYNGLRGNPPSD